MKDQPSPQKQIRRSRWALGLVIVGMLTLILACTPAPTPTIDFTLQRLTPVVNVGSDLSSLQKLLTDAPKPVSAGSFISTDHSGQGLLRGAVSVNETCKIYVFFDTVLRASACHKEAAQTGNTVTCQEEGTAVYQNCAGNLQQTPSGVIQIVGSWVVISYQPGSQLTLVSVLEGQAQVQPVIDFDTYSLGKPIPVEAGQLLFTTPGDAPPPIRGLQPRTPLPLEHLTAIVEVADLAPWYELMREQAIKDGVMKPEGVITPPPEEKITPEPQAEPPFVIQGAGGQLQEPAVDQAVLMGVDWGTIRTDIFSGNDAPIPVSLPQLDAQTTDEIPFNPEEARGLLAESGYANGFVLHLVTVEDDVHLRAAEYVAENLSKLDIKTKVYPTDILTAPDVLAELLSTDQAVLWFGPEIPPDWRKSAVITPIISPIPTEPNAQTVSLPPVLKESGALTSHEEAFPGVWMVGDDDQDAGVQLALSFDISSISPRTAITSAYLDLTSFKIIGDPFGDLGCLRAYVSEVPEFGPAAFGWKRPLGAIARWCSEDELREGGLQDDILATLRGSLGQKRYRVRLQFSDRNTNDDGARDIIQFEEPTLQITYIVP